MRSVLIPLRYDCGKLIVALLAAATGFIALPRCRAARAPEWLSACLAEGAPTRSDDTGAIMLLDSCKVQYQSADQVERTRRCAIRILTDSAHGQANVAMPYITGAEQIVSAQAWVVSADGKKMQRYDRKDFYDTAIRYNGYVWDQERQIIFTGADKIETGGVIAWEITSGFSQGSLGYEWNFLRHSYLLHGVFEAVPAPGETLGWNASTSRLRSPVPGDEPGSLRWAMSDVAALPPEQPTGFIPNPLRVLVRCLGPDRSARAGSTWEENSRFLAGLMLPGADDTPGLRAEAASLVAGRAARWDRIRALAEFVQSQVVYLEISSEQDYLPGIVPHVASEVLRNRFGDCKDKACLLISLLRAIGETGYVILVHAEDPTAVPADWPSYTVFNHAIVGVAAGATLPAGWPVVDGGVLGHLVIFDPTDNITPLGLLSTYDQAGLGLIVTPWMGRIVRLPVAMPDSSRVERHITAILTPTGMLKASLDESYFGISAAEWAKKEFDLPSDQFAGVMENRFGQTIPLAQGLQWSGHWDSSAFRYRLKVNFSAPQYGRPIEDGRMVVVPRIAPVDNVLPPWRISAEGSVWLPASELREETRLTAPAAYRVDEFPDGWSRQLPSASARLSYRLEGHDVLCQLDVTRFAGFYNQENYGALRLFYRKLNAAQRQPIILQSVAATDHS